MRAAFAGRPGTVLRRNSDYHPRYSLEWLSRASNIRLHHARPVQVGGKVVAVLLVSRSPRALFRGIYEDRGKIILGVVGIFGLLLFLAGLVSRGITRPIETLSAASREVALGRGSVPQTPATAAIEIRALYEDSAPWRRSSSGARATCVTSPPPSATSSRRRCRDRRRGRATTRPRRVHERRGPLAVPGEHLRRQRASDPVGHRPARHGARRHGPPGSGVAVDIAPSVRRLADGFAGRDVRVTVDLPAALPPVAVPQATVEKVLTVLIENSVQAGAGHIAITAEVKASTLCLSVSDDGPGFRETDCERLFEPFFTSRRADGGTGLGLPIARSLLAASHGAIAAVKPDAGARFEITLPLAAAASA